MPPKGFKKNTDPFSDLDKDFKESVASMSVDDIKKRVAETALELDKLMQAKKADQDLTDKKLAAKEAGQIYADGQKGAKLRIRYAQTILEARGMS